MKVKKLQKKPFKIQSWLQLIKKSDVVMTYIKRKVLASKGKSKTPQKFEQSIKDDNNDEITNNL